MRLFNFLEAVDKEVSAQIYDTASKKLLYEGDIGDIPHKIVGMRDIVLGTAQIENGVIQIYTQKCKEFDY